MGNVPGCGNRARSQRAQSLEVGIRGAHPSSPNLRSSWGTWASTRRQQAPGDESRCGFVMGFVFIPILSSSYTCRGCGNSLVDKGYIYIYIYKRNPRYYMDMTIFIEVVGTTTTVDFVKCCPKSCTLMMHK